MIGRIEKAATFSFWGDIFFFYCHWFFSLNFIEHHKPDRLTRGFWWCGRPIYMLPWKWPSGRDGFYPLSSKTRHHREHLHSLSYYNIFISDTHDRSSAVAWLVRRVPSNQEGPGSSPVRSMYVFQQDILSASLLSTQVYKWVPGRNGMSAPVWLPCLEWFLPGMDRCLIDLQASSDRANIILQSA